MTIVGQAFAAIQNKELENLDKSEEIRETREIRETQETRGIKEIKEIRETLEIREIIEIREIEMLMTGDRVDLCKWIQGTLDRQSENKSNIKAIKGTRINDIILCCEEDPIAKNSPFQCP